MTTKHTPTPWYVGSMSDCLYVIDTPPRPSKDDVGGWGDVLTVATLDYCHDEAKPNAEHIIRCVNSHDELLAACKEMYAALHRQLQGDNSRRDEDHNAVAFGVGAISKAEGRR